MRHSRNFAPWRTLLTLDKRVDQARTRLQRTTEVDPNFEHRVQVLMELVRKRDQVLASERLVCVPQA